jgi:tetratricopeptide (TPR) repeat protein
MPPRAGTGGSTAPRPAQVRTLADLAELLRQLRRRHARDRGGAPLSYREIAAATGWSHGIVGEYLAGRVLPPTDRFDTLVRLLGATPGEQGALATARDRVDDRRRRVPPAGRDTGAGVPRQLPAHPADLIGREAELAELDGLLAYDRVAAPAVVISGTAGVGKTALAVGWAHRVAERFPDGQLYVDLRGYDAERPLDSAAVLARFLRGLGVNAADIPADTAERAAWFRSLLAGRRALVVLDNAYAAEQVRPLLPGTPTSLAVVTSRDDLAGLVVREGARRLDLGMLGADEAVTLLRHLVGPRVADDPTTAGAIAAHCANLPLALRVAAELISAHPHRPLTDLLTDLGDERRWLDLFDAGRDPRTAIRAVFSWSYQHLSPPAARAFRLLGRHPGRELDGYGVAALADCDAPTARSLLDELARAHLVEPAGPAGYAMHDLLRAYAVELAGTAADGAAVTRLAAWYAHAAAAATDRLFPHERRPRPDGAPPLPPPPFDSADAALAWLDRQRANLVAVAEHAAGHGLPGRTVDLSRTLWRYFEVGGHYQEALAVHTTAVEVAAGPGMPAGALADVLVNLGNVQWWLGDHDAARTHFVRAADDRERAGDERGRARALARLGVVDERVGRYVDGLGHLGAAAAIHRRTGDRHGLAVQLVNLGAVHRRLGRHAEAAAHLAEAAHIFADLGDGRLEGYALGNLGAVHSALGRHREAIDLLLTALAHCHRAGDRGGEGGAHGGLGLAYLRARQSGRALAHLHRALAISRDTGDRGLETEALNSLGETLRAMRQPWAALARHHAALDISRRTGERFEWARAMDGIGTTLLRTHRRARARHHLRRALAVYLRLGVPRAGAVRALLARPAPFPRRSAAHAVDGGQRRRPTGGSRRRPAKGDGAVRG